MDFSDVEPDTMNKTAMATGISEQDDSIEQDSMFSTKEHEKERESMDKSNHPPSHSESTAPVLVPEHQDPIMPKHWHKFTMKAA